MGDVRPIGELRNTFKFDFIGTALLGNMFAEVDERKQLNRSLPLLEITGH